MLKFMNDERIFDIELSQDKTMLEIMESCDNYFSVDLTKQQVLELIADFQDLADEMINT